jgi:uncharacterized iron-regulated membrane protein
MSAVTNSLIGRPRAATLYRAIWRWHFYAGLIVVPFLLVLSLTGIVMLYGNSIETMLGKTHSVPVSEKTLSLEAQAAAGVASIEGSTLKMVVSPVEADRATMVVVKSNDQDVVVTIDPNDGSILDTVVKDDTWFHWASNIHGTLLIGDAGDRMMEIAAGLGIILVLSGLYLWWPRGETRLSSVLIPNFAASGRAFWKELHISTGFWFSLVMLGFLVTGLAWSGIWGGKMVQAWSTFPAAKWDNVPLSDKTHAAMNHGALKEVPWALEQTPLPESGSDAGITGLPIGTAVNLNSVAHLARQIGFTTQFRINVPQDEAGVYTISADSMDGDTTSPFGDRTVHVDRFTGKILADVKFADYSLGGKSMAIGIALHQGNTGWWNTALNLMFCLAIIFMTVSGVVMWWKRRPSNASAKVLGAPLYPKDFRMPVAIMVIGAAVCIAFPLTGIAVLLFALVDVLLPKRFKEIGAAG